MATSNTLNTVLLIIIATVALALCILAAIYVLVYWSEKSEVWRTIVPRIFIIISLTLVYFIPLLIPIDVSIKYLAPDLNFMNLVWEILVYVVMCMTIIIMPFIMFSMEERLNYEKSWFKTLGCAFAQTLVAIFVIICLTIILYFTMGKVDLNLPLYGQVCTDQNYE